MRVYFYVFISAILGLHPFHPIERALEKRIMKGADGVEDVHIEIHGSRIGFMLFGFCRRVVVDIRGLSIGGLRTARFLIEVEGLKFRPFYTFVLDKARVRGAKNIRWTLRMLDEDLEKFMRKKGPVLSGIEVRIDEERITLHRGAGFAALFSLNETFTLRGKLEVDGNKNVNLKLDHFSAFGISPGRTLVGTISAIVNPIIKARDITSMLAANPLEELDNSVPVTTLENITLSTGHAEIHGTVELVKAEKKKAEVKQEVKKTAKKKPVKKTVKKKAVKKKEVKKKENKPKKV